MDDSPTNPDTTTSTSQLTTSGASSENCSPAYAPTSVATPLPPRKPCHTGNTCPTMAASAQVGAIHAGGGGAAAAPPGTGSRGSHAAASHPFATSMMMTQMP